MATISFQDGLVVLRDIDKNLAEKLPSVCFDDRTLCWTAPAMAYRDIMMMAHKYHIPLQDLARGYEHQPLELTLGDKTPRPYQQLAIDRFWEVGQRRGVVILPTGAGKTFVAMMAMVKVARPTLIIVPTIDLMHQWREVLTHAFKRDIGCLGGGERQVEDITVSTFESAKLLLDQIGARFGFLIVDECHHLPGPNHQLVARGCLAPFRLGLTATLERGDGQEGLVFELLGPKVHETRIEELTENVLAPYDVVEVPVDLTEEERQVYESQRQIWKTFCQVRGVRLGGARGWQHLLSEVARSGDEGREALRAWRTQSKVASSADGKFKALWEILCTHAGERVIVFTSTNRVAYKIGQMFLLPVLTCQTKPQERKKLLQSFRDGDIQSLVTSKVLNEGVDVPEASVAVVMSGSGQIREHVQRLGRILRSAPGKSAVMYEVVANETSEMFVHERRRQHSAYQRPS
ncbi:MAG: DEAD/DEAH box helicase family protein [Oligoflexales bacterium]